MGHPAQGFNCRGGTINAIPNPNPQPVQRRFCFVRQPNPHFMSTDILEPSVLDISTAFDPLADSSVNNKGDAGDYIHIRIQQRNGKKSLTTVQGLKEKYDYNKVLKALKKAFNCNGTVVEDTELGKVIQLQGDQRKNVSEFLIENKITKKEHIKLHGF